MLQIRGEAGKTLDATLRLLPVLKLNEAMMIHQHLGEDRLSLTCRTKDIDAGDVVLPEGGQVVELWEAPTEGSTAGGTRLFRGRAQNPELHLYGARIVVEGPWAWMERTAALEDDAVGGNSVQPVVRFPAGTLEDHFTAVVGAMVTAGAPMQLGTIAAGFDVPLLEYEVGSWAEVIRRLMDWLSDAVVWFDYSAATGEPKMMLSRRSAMTAETFTVGVTNLLESGFSLRSMAEKLSGKGVGNTGPDPDTELPFDSFEYYDLAGTAWTTANREAIILAGDSQFEGAVANGLTTELIIGGSVSWGSSTGGPYNTRSKSWPVPATTASSSGATINLTGRSLLTNPTSPPQWVIDQYGLVRATISGPFGVVVTKTLWRQTGSSTHSFVEGYADPAWLSYLDVTSVGQGYTSNAPPDVYGIFVFEGSYSLEAWTVKTSSIPALSYLEGTATAVTGSYSRQWDIGAHSFTADQLIGKKFEVYWNSTYGFWPMGVITGLSGNIVTVNGHNPALYTGTRDYRIVLGRLARRPIDDGVLNPPSGLPAELLATQAWTPYEGAVPVQHATIPTDSAMSKKYHVAGLTVDLAAAGMMPQRSELNLATRVRTLSFGVHSWLSYRGIVSRMAGDATDSVITL